MRIFILISLVFFLAGCASSEKMLEQSTPKKTGTNLSSSNNDMAQHSPASAAQNKPLYQNPPAMSIDTAKKYSATLVTSKGNIEVELDAKNTPITVNNFVFLAREKFYDGVIFHRTIADFMIQGGDPTGTGMGGPGYKFADEPFNGEYTRGTVAMANSGPNTNGSQFFIMHKDTGLPKNYVIFGRVTEGLSVVDAIATAPTGSDKETPQSPVMIQSIEIHEE